MPGVPQIGKTMVGKKLLIAATGLVLLLYLVGHMAGNLKALMGADAVGVPHIDHYAHFLRTMGEPLLPAETLLWTARAVLLVSLIVHVVLVVQLVVQNRKARPVPYARYRSRVSTWAAKSMMVTGILILGFVVFHILHLTTGSIRFGDFEHVQVYSNLYHSFRHPLAAIVYLVMMVLVSLHVYHGGWSLFQSWGLDNPDRNAALRWGAKIVAIGLLIGFSLIPLLFWTGVLPEPPAGYSEIHR